MKVLSKELYFESEFFAEYLILLHRAKQIYIHVR